MNKETGYTKPLFIMAFDHRASFAKMIMGKEDLSAAEVEQVRHYKYLIYQGLLKAIEQGVPKEQAAVLVDEYSGDKVLQDARAQGLTTILTTEKSGKPEFMFEYEDFGAHIEKYKPTFTKALVRYNPEGDMATNGRSREQLKILGDYSHSHGYKFLIEPLIPAIDAQLAQVSGDKHRYDLELRPDLTVRMIKEMQQAGVNPDIWKIEGLDESVSYEQVVAQARSGGRDNVSCVILGRGESNQGVEKWINAGKNVSGMVGFAIGRTIFAESLAALHQQKISEAEAVEQISKNYFHFYQVFTSK